MKTLSKNIALFATALLISLNTLAGGFEFDNEQYIDDIPFDLEKVAIMTKYQKAIEVEFSFNEEETINDLPFSHEQLTIISLYNKALAVDFELEEEEYISDIPESLFHFDTLVSIASIK